MRSILITSARNTSTPTAVKQLGKRRAADRESVDGDAWLVDDRKKFKCPRCNKSFHSEYRRRDHIAHMTPACLAEEARRQQILDLPKHDVKPNETRVVAPLPSDQDTPPPSPPPRERFSGLDLIAEAARRELDDDMASSMVPIQTLNPAVVKSVQKQSRPPPKRAVVMSVPLPVPTAAAELVAQPAAQATSSPHEPSHHTLFAAPSQIARTHAPPTVERRVSTTDVAIRAIDEQLSYRENVQRLHREIQLIKADIGGEYKRRETYDRESRNLLQTKMLQLANYEVLAWEKAEKK